MLDHNGADSTAFALERLNFDYLPDDQSVGWRRDFLSSRKSRIPGPEKLIIELLNSCNLDCPMCRVGQHGVNLERAMPLSLFERVIEEAPSARSIRLNGLGESTLLPNFASYLGVLERRGLAIELISNGSGPVGSYARIFDNGGHVLVSWDAATPATFEKLRRPAKWQPYQERLREIGGLAVASHRGRLSLIFTLQKGNIGELPGVVELAAAVHASGVQMNVAKLPGMSWVGSQWPAIARDVALASDMAGRLGVTLHIPDQVAGAPIAGNRTAATAARGCRAPWQEVVIRWNGDVQVCNMFNPYTYGNVHRTPLQTIWRNQFASLFRSKLNGDDVHPYCRDCAYMASAYA